MADVIRSLSQGKRVQIPTYDFVTHTRTEETTDVYGVDIVLLEGILVFYEASIRASMNMKLFVDTDADTRLIRRSNLLVDFRLTLGSIERHKRSWTRLARSFETISDIR